MFAQAAVRDAVKGPRLNYLVVWLVLNVGQHGPRLNYSCALFSDQQRWSVWAHD